MYIQLFGTRRTNAAYLLGSDNDTLICPRFRWYLYFETPRRGQTKSIRIIGQSRPMIHELFIAWDSKLKCKVQCVGFSVEFVFFFYRCPSFLKACLSRTFIGQGAMLANELQGNLPSPTTPLNCHPRWLPSCCVTVAGMNTLPSPSRMLCSTEACGSIIMSACPVTSTPGTALLETIPSHQAPPCARRAGIIFVSRILLSHGTTEHTPSYSVSLAADQPRGSLSNSAIPGISSRCTAIIP